MQKAEGQIKGIDESIHFTGQQISGEEKELNELSAQLENFRKEVDARRLVLDEKEIC